ncbi:MAG: efflux RND transporter permease subunit, partial [Gemmatimonadota bacterium]
VVALIGMVMLVGIVVNNGIVLVDYVNVLRREEGYDLDEALIEAGRVRFRPIVMSTLTTVLGLLPLALIPGEGAELRVPLAIPVIGGLIVSTILTLIVVPVLYRLVEARGERRRLETISRRPGDASEGEVKESGELPVPVGAAAGDPAPGTA